MQAAGGGTLSTMNPVATPPSVDVEQIRRRFPALGSETVFLENAGGSQVPAVVADAIRDYMLTTYVQLGAGYDEANACDRVVNGAHDFVNRLMNGEGTGTVMLGPSSSQFVAMLARGYAEVLAPGDEVVVMEAGHEANIGPWLALADRGVTVRTWRIDPASFTSPLDDLRRLLNERTRIVAFVHVSNLLGGIVDVRAVTELAHAAGARVVVDGVAYAPHRAIDVAAWDVDWYLYSTYKVYGPHMGVLYGRHDAIRELTGPNHFFIADDDVPYKFELGGVNHEGCAGLLGLAGYLAFLAGLGGRDGDAAAGDGPGPGAGIDRGTIEQAFAVMAACERPLQQRMIDALVAAPSIRIIGPDHVDDDRVGTISFVDDTRSSREIVAAARAAGIGIRHGHMYAHRLCTALGLDPEDGVVRVSIVHYNTIEEIDRLLEVL